MNEYFLSDFCRSACALLKNPVCQSRGRRDAALKFICCLAGEENNAKEYDRVFRHDVLARFYSKNAGGNRGIMAGSIIKVKSLSGSSALTIFDQDKLFFTPYGLNN